MEPRLYRDDLDADFLSHARKQGEIAWDIETTGLDWAPDQIGTCQLAVGSDVAVVQLSAWDVPHGLRSRLKTQPS